MVTVCMPFALQHTGQCSENGLLHSDTDMAITASKESSFLNFIQCVNLFSYNESSLKQFRIHGKIILKC